MVRMEHVVAAALAASGLMTAGCGDERGTDELLVLAASSLTEAFSSMEHEFEAADAEKIGALTRGVAALPVEERN